MFNNKEKYVAGITIYNGGTYISKGSKRIIGDVKGNLERRTNREKNKGH